MICERQILMKKKNRLVEKWLSLCRGCWPCHMKAPFVRVFLFCCCSGVHPTPSQQAAGPASQAAVGHEIQGKPQIHQMLPWLGQVQGGAQVRWSHHYTSGCILLHSATVLCADGGCVAFQERHTSAGWHTLCFTPVTTFSMWLCIAL